MSTEPAAATMYSAGFLIANASDLFVEGALVAEKGRILSVGPLASLQTQYPQATWVDFGDAIILPAFVNAHTHLELSGYPDWASAVGVGAGPCSFVDWILRLITVKRNLQPHHLDEAVSRGQQLCLEAGTAAVGDILSRFEARTLFANSPLHGKIFLESLGQDQQLTQQGYKKLWKVLKEVHSGLLNFGVSPHSPYTIRPGYMTDLYALCRKKKLSCCTHIAEASAEVDFLDGGEGELVERLYPAVNWHQHLPPARRITPIGFLQERGGLFADQLLVHGVQLTPPEMDSIAASGATLVLCPRSNAHLQVGRAPVAALKHAGVKLALGTDSLASNSSLSLWDEMAFAASEYAGALSPAELFDLATRGGAVALGLGDELGALQPGMRCSFQVLGCEGPSRTENLLEALVTTGEGRAPETLILDGNSVL